MNARQFVRRLVLCGLVLFVVAVGARYAYAVFGKFGLSSPLGWNLQVAGHAAAASARADWRNLRRLLSGPGRRIPAAEMQNENFGEMRVPISRESLRMLPEVPADAAAEEFRIEKGLLTLAREVGLAAAAGETPGGVPAVGPAATAPRRDWIVAAGNDASQRHSPLTQIDAGNVANLTLKYSMDAAELFGGRWEASVQASPMAWDRYLYWLTADQRLVAVEAASGRLVWHVLVPRLGYARRGFLIQPDDDGAQATLYVPFGPFIGAFDARTGAVDRSRLGNGIRRLDGWTVISPAIVDDTLLVALYDKRSIVGLDLASGEQRWSLSLHEDEGFEGGTQWGGMTIDRETNTLFVTTGNPRPALIGITRPGANRHSDSVIAIDLATRAIKWAFQEVAHDVWDLDVPGSPMLTTLRIDGRDYQVVTTITKMGNTLLLDRATGRPIHDFRWRRAPRSRMANDRMPDYQPDVELPEPLISLPWDPSRITRTSEERRASVEAQINTPGTIFGRFRAPELNKDLITFGLHGGAEWHGASVDPDGTVYVPVNNIPWVLRVYLLGDPEDDGEEAPVYQAQCASCHLPSRNGQFESVGEAARTFVPSLHAYTLLEENRRHFAQAEFKKRPAHAAVATTQPDLDRIWAKFAALDDDLFESGSASMIYHWRQLLDKDAMPGSAPPWGMLAAVNLVTGRKLWDVPLGEKLIDGRRQDTGSPSYGGLLGTAGGLLFVVGTDDHQIRAIDKRSGATLWRYNLDAAGSAPPISFEVDGQQYVAVVASGGRFHNFVERANKLYVFGL